MIVVDASVVANAIGDDGGAGEAARRILRSDSTLAAPDLVDAESVAVLRRAWLAGTMTDERFEQAVGDLADLPIVRYATRRLMHRALVLRANVTSYDACYVALAEGLDCPLYTGDRRLVNATGPHCEMRLVSDR
ncbi:MAG: type II toxin-antitoxin system VapC family toxin [Actinomycetia bacterium]|nr:type II toxin-antitoxin system VapC family toxin [Actinomycetes bacterium]